MSSDQPIREKALSSLARREYSAWELAFRLNRDFDSERVAIVMQQLKDQGLQSDVRYAEAVTRSRGRRGQGPVKIQAELQQKGVAEEIIDQALATAEVDWHQLAAETYRRRFPDTGISDPSERAKRMRFLQNKGFNLDHIQYAITQES